MLVLFIIFLSLDEEEDEDDTVPPKLSLATQGRKSQPGKRNRYVYSYTHDYNSYLAPCNQTRDEHLDFFPDR